MAAMAVTTPVLTPVAVCSGRSSFAGKRIAAAGPKASPRNVALAVTAKAPAHPHRVALPIPTKNVGITKEPLVDMCVNAIRFLAIDAVEKAKSGHPGLPMGCAPMGYVLYNEVMRHSPSNASWFNRDRFILSAGHGCMLQYALLHLTGYPSVQMKDLQSFRQLGSNAPGHPENFVTKGIEVTTGPLGAGIANGVGLALAEKHMAARFNKPDCEIVDHYTYVIMGDGCNMEGVSGEAASLAGHWGLGKLIVLYDDNGISIDGHTDISFTEDTSKRFESYGWHVSHVKDGNVDYNAIRNAIEDAKKVKDKPSFIKVTTIIGYGSPNKADTHDVHGAALGGPEVEATRKNLGWNHAPFDIPAEVTKAMGATVQKGKDLEAAWAKKMEAYSSKYPKEAAEFKGLISGALPAGWDAALPKYEVGKGDDASRNHSQANLNALARVLPGLIGGSADLAPSNMTLMKMFGDFQKDSAAERNVRFGVREHGMGCIANGIGLHNPGLIPYCATFFIFTDYMRAAMRLAALSETGTIFVMTHDSIGLGEDGPTHQPIEHLASFRAMPNILMMRPADGNETAGCYKVAIQSRKRPTILALSRQKLRNMKGTSHDGVAKGGYIIHETVAGGKPDVILMGTGSELNMAEDAAVALEKEGIKTRVVSMVCTELFDEQTPAYKESVLPAAVTARVSVEAGSTYGWDRYVGWKGKAIGVDSFGASAPAPALYKHFGITLEAVIAAAKTSMKH